MSINALSSDLVLDISQYLDGQSMQNFAQAWQPMKDVLYGSQGTRARYRIELDKYGMVEGPIPAHIRNQPATMLYRSLIDYSNGLSCLQWRKFEKISIPKVGSVTTWTGGENPRERNPHAFMGESGGCLYHAVYDRAQNHTSLTIWRPTSLRTQRAKQTNRLVIETRVTAVAIDQHRDVVVLLQSDVKDWSILHFVSLSTGQILREAFRWDSRWRQSIEPRQFEIFGDWVVMAMADNRGWHRLQVFNWKEDYLWEGPVVESFQFTTEDCLVLLQEIRTDPRSGGIKIRISSISLDGDLSVQSLPSVYFDVGRNFESVDQVSLVQNAALPPKLDLQLQGYFELTNDVYDTDPYQQSLDGPFHSNPSTQLMGIKVEFKREYQRPPTILLFDRAAFFNSGARTPLVITGYFATLNGRRVTWIDPSQGRICVRDFNVNATRVYRPFTSAVHPQDSNWIMSSQAVAHTKPPGVKGWIEDSSFVCAALCPVQNPLRVLTTEDSLVILTHGSAVGKPDAQFVALVYCF